MFDTKISMISLQPFCFAKAGNFKRVRYNNGRFVLYTASFRIPQGCELQLVADYASTVLFSTAEDFAPLLITPVVTSGQQLRLPRGEYYSVKLSPYASYAVYHLFARIPRFSDRILPAAEVFSDIESLHAALRDADGHSDVLSLLPAYFAERFRFAPFAPHIERLISLIMLSNCTVTEKELAEQSGLSSRRIYQLFTEKVGCSPKMFSRILRFQNALYSLLSGSGGKNGLTPYELNYYDQSHYLKEFHKFCGILPSEMLKLMAGRTVN